MIRNLTLAFNIFKAGGRIREHRSQYIIRAHALYLRRNFLATLKTQQSQRAVRVPTPARAKNWRIKRRLLQDWLHGIGFPEKEPLPKRENLLLRQCGVQSGACCRRLLLQGGSEPRR